jgi:hypothetical protein
VTTQTDDSGGLLIAAAAGDVEAFGLFYDMHVATLLRWFYKRTACAETAADLTAETFCYRSGFGPQVSTEQGERSTMAVRNRAPFAEPLPASETGRH